MSKKPMTLFGSLEGKGELWRVRNAGKKRRNISHFLKEYFLKNISITTYIEFA